MNEDLRERYERYEAAYRTALVADNAWQAELATRYGAAAGDVRYTHAGKGEPGTALNTAYLAYQAAAVEYSERMGEFLG